MGLAILNTQSQIDKRISVLVKSFINHVFMGEVFPCHTTRYGLELMHLAEYHTESESRFCETFLNHPMVERAIKKSPVWTDDRRFKFPRVYLGANIDENGNRVMPGLVWFCGSEWFSVGVPVDYDDIMETVWRKFAEDGGVFTLPHADMLFADTYNTRGKNLYEQWQGYKDFLDAFDPKSFKALKLIK
tara:strand:- start:463 stop:1026 length:564 start_codon:yes stop_codon:yes gene_type:complete